MERTLSDGSHAHAGRVGSAFCRGWSCSPDSTPRTSENYTRLGAVRSGSDPRDRTRRASRSPHAIASVLGWHRVGHIFALRLASQFQTRGRRDSDSPCSVNLALPRSEIGDAAGHYVVVTIQRGRRGLAMAKEHVTFRFGARDSQQLFRVS